MAWLNVFKINYYLNESDGMVNLILTLNSSPLPVPLCHVILQFVPIKIVKYISPLLSFGLGNATLTNILEEIIYQLWV